MTRLLVLVALVCAAFATPVAAASLTVEGEIFVLTLDDGKRMTSPELVGAELESDLGLIRIEAVSPDPDRPTLLLHDFRTKNEAGEWVHVCDPDAKGRRVGFPVAGRFDARGAYIKDPAAWFVTCTSGSQGKCVLWGYDPWGQGPNGEPLDRLYQTCQHTVRADYDGGGEAHTRNGTIIDVADDIGLLKWDSEADPGYAFEAGWGPDGAVCVARTRWQDLLPAEKLWKDAPRLAGPCDRETARARGAIIFTRVKINP